MDFDAIDTAPIDALPASLVTATFPSVGTLTKGGTPTAVSVLLEVDSYNTGNASVSTNKWAGRGLIFPGNEYYAPRVASPITIAQNGADALGIGGRVGLTLSDVMLSNEDLGLDTMAYEGLALGRVAAVKTMPAYYDGGNVSKSDLGGGNISGAVTLFRGYVASMTPDRYGMRLAISDLAPRLDVPLQSAQYTGAGGMDGPPELKGLYKPVALGYCFNVSPVALGLVDLGYGSLPTYQTNGGAILSHEAVRIRGVLQEKVTVTPGVGQFVDVPAQGCFQLGSTPDGSVTCDVRGDMQGVDYAVTTAGVIERALRYYGALLSASDIDSDSFARATVNLPGEIGWYHGTSPITQLRALEEICGNTGVWLAGGRDGKFRLSLARGNLADIQATIEAGNVVALWPEPLPAMIATPPSSVEVGYALNWTPLSDIAGSVSDADKALLSGGGRTAKATSSTLAARVAPAKPIRFGGLFRFEDDARVWAEAWRDWLETGLQAFRVRTDRYRGQINLGHVVKVESYPCYGLSGGFTGLVAAWSEDAETGQTEMILIG